MRKPIERIASVTAGMAYALLLCVSARAQDVELFLGNNDPANTAKPNILLILDNSFSMGPVSGTVLTQNGFDPVNGTYSGSCQEDRVYWSTNGTPPDCSTENYFNMSALKCQRALTAFGASRGGDYNDIFAQYDPTQQRWETIAASEKSRLIECADDLPDASSGWPGNGADATSPAVYPRNGNNSQLWTSNADDPSRIVWGANPTHQTYQVYSGKYMNWYYGSATAATRLEVIQDVAINLLNSINGVNVGLMYFNGDEGGLVAHQIEDVATARPELEDIIKNMQADSTTTLQETLYEAYQYLTGGQVVYGDRSVAASRQPAPNDNLYESPIDFSCQKTSIVYLTDGWPYNDEGATSSILGLTDAEGESFHDLVGATCDAETHPSGLKPPPSGGECLDDLAEFMNKADLSPLPGRQNATVVLWGPEAEPVARPRPAERHDAHGRLSHRSADSERYGRTRRRYISHGRRYGDAVERSDQHREWHSGHAGDVHGAVDRGQCLQPDATSQRRLCRAVPAVEHDTLARQSQEVQAARIGRQDRRRQRRPGYRRQHG